MIFYSYYAPGQVSWTGQYNMHKPVPITVKKKKIWFEDVPF